MALQPGLADGPRTRIAPGTPAAERDNYEEVVLERHLRDTLDMNRFSNRTFITIAALVVLVIMIDILMVFAWDWFQSGRPDSGWLKIALPAIGGSVVALVPLGFTLWRTRLTQQQIVLTSQNSRYDRYQRGIEMLGSPELFVRLSRIHRWTRTEGVRTLEGGVRKLQTRWPGLEFG